MDICRFTSENILESVVEDFLLINFGFLGVSSIELDILYKIVISNYF